jgi:4a-hydroxytetrahydrobiopterin dehydratase
MHKHKILTPEEINEALALLPAWRHQGNALKVSYKFPSFMQAMTFMNACAAYAEALDHHPDWSNCYTSVRITLSTHDAGNKVTDLDMELARLMASEYDKLR